MVADGAAEHRVFGLEGVEDRALRDRSWHVEFHFGPDLREPAEMEGEFDPDHFSNGSVTAGRRVSPHFFRPNAPRKKCSTDPGDPRSLTGCSFQGLDFDREDCGQVPD